VTSAWKKFFGVDLFDTVVHLGITIGLMVLIAEKSRQAEPVILFASLSAVVYSVRRHFALKALKREPEVSGAYVTGETELRLRELEQLYSRMAELEERVDFAERLLAKKDDARALEAPR
jgi:hypothetical protein